MSSQLFYAGTFSFGIHLQRSLAILQNGNLERNGFPLRRFVAEIRNLRKLGSLGSLVEPGLSLSPSHARAQISARRVCSHGLFSPTCPTCPTGPTRPILSPHLLSRPPFGYAVCRVLRTAVANNCCMCYIIGKTVDLNSEEMNMVLPDVLLLQKKIFVLL